MNRNINQDTPACGLYIIIITIIFWFAIAIVPMVTTIYLIAAEMMVQFV
jgi:hypothetical protein